MNEQKVISYIGLNLPKYSFKKSNIECDSIHNINELLQFVQDDNMKQYQFSNEDNAEEIKQAKNMVNSEYFVQNKDQFHLDMTALFPNGYKYVEEIKKGCYAIVERRICWFSSNDYIVELLFVCNEVQNDVNYSSRYITQRIRESIHDLAKGLIKTQRRFFDM